MGKFCRSHFIYGLPQQHFNEDDSRIRSVRVLRVTRVKSYGPRVSHLVLDLECRPGGG